MGLDTIRSFFSLDDDDDYMDDPYDEYDQLEEEAPVRHKAPSKPRAREEYEEPRQRASFLERKPKVVSMSRGSMEVKIVKPHTFEDSQEICNLLLNGRPVIVNLEGFDPDDAQRIMDFISGSIYAINGKYHQISKYIFIFSPENIDISGDSLSVDGSTASMPVINRDF
ncbi:MAG: cell division protein SepF [Eubacterium sp.]|nr:cell division protein SepF [Eubacterium sp.]